MTWLRTLGPIQANFSILSITFTHLVNSITLKGDLKTHPIDTTFHQFHHLFHTDYVASLHLMIFHPLDYSTNTLTSNQSLLEPLPPNLHLEIHSLFTNYPTIFHPQTGLPLTRPHDHHITLLPNTPPINVKPCRYPHSQKDAMTTIIQDILKEGIIIPSHNHFSEVCDFLGCL